MEKYGKMKKSLSDCNLHSLQRYTKKEIWLQLQSSHLKLSNLMQNYKILHGQKENLMRKLIEQSKSLNVECCSSISALTTSTQTEEINHSNKQLNSHLTNHCCHGDVDQLRFSLITMRETLSSLEQSLVHSDNDQKILMKELRKVKARNQLLNYQLQMYCPGFINSPIRMGGGANGGINFNKFKHKKGSSTEANEDKAGSTTSKSNTQRQQRSRVPDPVVERYDTEQVDFLKKQIDDLIEMVSRRDNTIFRLCEDVVAMRECKENAEKKLSQVVNCHNEAIAKVLDQLNDANKDLFVLSECLHKKVEDSYPLSHFLDVVKVKVRRELENTHLTRERNNLLYEINTVHLQNENLRSKLDERDPSLHEEEVNSLIDALKAEIKDLDQRISPSKLQRNLLAAGSEADLSQWATLGLSDSSMAERGCQSTREGITVPSGSARKSNFNQRDRSGSDPVKKKTTKSYVKKMAPMPPNMYEHGDQLCTSNHSLQKSCVKHEDNKKKDFFSWWKHMSQER